MNIFLHRDDLRLHDNTALKKASEKGEVIPVYVEDPRVEQRTGKNKKAFRENALEKLDEKYRDEGSSLIYREGKTVDKVQEIAEQYDADTVFFNRSYTPLKRRIEDELHDIEPNTRDFKDRLLVEPQELEKEYGTFSPFYNAWKNVEKNQSRGKPENLASIDTERYTAEAQTGIVLPEAGEDAALEKWRDFRDNRLENYRDDRDEVERPESVSRLSMYYSSGIIGLRKVLEDVERKIENEGDSDSIRNYAKYRNELAWREFFYQVLYHNPETVNQNYRDFPETIEWRNSSEEFKAWKKGETGIPFVDAGMRELRNTGYMHNRTRQNVASFLTKYLMIDWRKGANFFRKHLIDHDTASNIGGWQWSASTGTDSVSIRIFNPVKQGRKYDSHARYIKRHVPELRDLDPNSIHN